MSKLIVLTLLVSTFLVYGSQTTAMADQATEVPSALIQCSTCTMSFASATEAAKHMADYPGHEAVVPADPVIKCSTCGVEFTSPDLWKEHLKKHPDHKTQ
jgi:YgiT-type zinc finger domain-containing protein